jgi:hypothetical protein
MLMLLQVLLVLLHTCFCKWPLHTCQCCWLLKPCTLHPSTNRDPHSCCCCCRSSSRCQVCRRCHPRCCHSCCYSLTQKGSSRSRRCWHLLLLLQLLLLLLDHLCKQMLRILAPTRPHKLLLLLLLL